MSKKLAVQYNAVMDVDLFYTIYDWMRMNPDTLKRDFNVVTMYDFDKLTLEDWVDLADTAIDWLEKVQLPKVTIMDKNCPSPSLDSWLTLYYQTLAYMNDAHPWEPTYRSRSYSEQLELCKECIANFKKLRNEIREPNDNDI